jgi:hypothetical protein
MLIRGENVVMLGEIVSVLSPLLFHFVSSFLKIHAVIRLRMIVLY